MKKLFWLCSISFLLACSEKAKQEPKNKEIVYDMYEPSEMATLMNQMYEANLALKKEIEAGNTPTEFPKDFLKIHTAELSNFKSRNEKFKAYSQLFITTEKEIFNTNSTLDTKERFNNTINVCVSCHQTECTGPIPKIKKLFIK